MQTLFIVLILISSVGVILSTILMDPKAEGMGSISGSSVHLFNHPSRGKEKFLDTLVKIFGILFTISTIALALVS